MMRILLTLFLAVIVDGPKTGDQGPSPDEQFRALRDAHQAAFDAFVKAGEDAKTPEDFAKHANHPGGKTPQFMPGFMDLARKYPGTPAAEDALLWVGTHAVYSANCEEAKRLLIRDHIRSAKLGPTLGWQGHYADYFEGSEAFFRKVLAENPNRDIQGLACYWLARHLTNKAVGVRHAKKNPNFGFFEGKDIYNGVFGKDWPDRLSRLDPDALDREADALFERVVKFYSDVPHNDKRRKPGSLGEAASSFVQEHRELAIGKAAPLIEGIDLDGRKFRLEDCRGKVVVLDFGSHFYCGSCRQMYPQMRELTKRLAGKPFILVSINAEPEKDLKQLKDAWTEEGNTWRCLFDGDGEGPIQKAWNVQRFPTIYVLDAKGVIRQKDLIGKDLDTEIDKLITEAAALR